MKKKIIKITLWLVGIISFLIIVSVLLVYVNREEIKAVFVKELNKQLLTEIKVSAIDIEFFSTFPLASLTLDNVLAYDAFPSEQGVKTRIREKNSDDTLFFFKKLYLTFNVWDIVKEDYNIKTIIANDGCFNMKVNSNAEVNYEFWKPSESKTESNFSLSLKKISLNNIKYSYKNDCTKQYFEIFLKSSQAKGDFTSNQQEIKFRSNSRIKKMQIDNLLISQDRDMDIDIDFSNNTITKTMSVKQGELVIDGFKFGLTGSMTYADSTLISLLVKGRDINLGEMISLFPEDFRNKFNDYDSKGELVFNFQMQGLIDKTNMPSLNADFIIKNGELRNKKTGITFSKINLKGNFSNGVSRNSETSFLKLDNFSFFFNEGQIKGYAKLNNFANLSLDANVNANVNLKTVHKFIQVKEITELTGLLNIDFKIQGDIKSLEKVKDKGLNEITMSGKGSVKSLNYKDTRIPHPIANLSSDFVFNNTTIDIEKLNGYIGTTSILFNGKVEEILPFVFNQCKVFNLKGDLKVGILNTNEWLSKTDNTKPKDNIKDQNPKDRTSESIFPLFLNAELNAEIKKLIYEKSEIDNFKSKIKLINGNLILDDLSFNAYGGSVSGKMSMLLNSESPKLIGDINIIKVNSSKFFYSMDNFGQNSLTNKNIEGDITAKINFSAELDKNNDFLNDKLSVNAKYKIEDGKLIDIPLLKKLSYFVDEAALNRISFEKIESSISINKSCVTIDEIDIKSNAVNFSFLGKHYFNKNIDYRAEIKLSELASKKKKAKLDKIQKEFGEIQQDASSRTSLFVKITGTTDKPIFSYDTKKSIEIAKQKLKADTKTITSSIDKELKLGIDEMKQDKKNWKIQEKGEYIIEWGEEKKDSVSNSKDERDTKFNIEW
ncbi:MAG TPA: AsmA-like C-terminal region-containing protein [Bacteroidales bacterium]|nr:AsmA-like C-terminal region-containing protein [Bacteroidales bacterium]